MSALLPLAGACATSLSAAGVVSQSLACGRSATAILQEYTRRLSRAFTYVEGEVLAMNLRTRKPARSASPGLLKEQLQSAPKHKQIDRRSTACSPWSALRSRHALLGHDGLDHGARHYRDHSDYPFRPAATIAKSSGGRLFSWTRLSKAPNPLTYPSSKPLASSWSSTLRPPGSSASPCRNR